jgi:Uma2 family endonuclease
VRKVAHPVVRRKFTVDEYHRLPQTGILREDDRVELIEGEIVEMSPIGARHAGTVKRLLDRLIPLQVARKAVLGVQDPIRLGKHSEPQPDIVLLCPRADFYTSAHPGPQDVLLVVEVAETSADYDRQLKLPVYARAGIPEVWLVDLAQEHVELYRAPSPDGYREVRVLPRGERVAPAAFPDLELPTEDLLG